MSTCMFVYLLGVVHAVECVDVKGFTLNRRENTDNVRGRERKRSFIFIYLLGTICCAIRNLCQAIRKYVLYQI